MTFVKPVVSDGEMVLKRRQPSDRTPREMFFTPANLGEQALEISSGPMNWNVDLPAWSPEFAPQPLGHIADSPVTVGWTWMPEPRNVKIAEKPEEEDMSEALKELGYLE